MSKTLELRIPTDWSGVPFKRLAEVMDREGLSEVEQLRIILGITPEQLRQFSVRDWQRLVNRSEWALKPPTGEGIQEPLAPFKVGDEEWEVISDLTGAPMGLWADMETDLNSDMKAGEKSIHLIGRAIKPVTCEPYKGYNPARAREVAGELPTDLALSISGFFAAAGTLFAQFSLIFTADPAAGDRIRGALAQIGLGSSSDLPDHSST
jgi:hypothetical protein